MNDEFVRKDVFDAKIEMLRVMYESTNKRIDDLRGGVISRKWNSDLWVQCLFGFLRGFVYTSLACAAVFALVWLIMPLFF